MGIDSGPIFMHPFFCWECHGSFWETIYFKRHKNLLIPLRFNQLATHRSIGANPKPSKESRNIFLTQPMAKLLGISFLVGRLKLTLLGTNISLYIPSKNNFEDFVPFPKVGYVSSLEGIFFVMVLWLVWISNFFPSVRRHYVNGRFPKQVGKMFFARGLGWA